MKVPRDGRESVAARAHVQDVERDLLVDWRRDRIPESSQADEERKRT